VSERIVAIVQARMGSTRLPGKVLEPIGDKPMLAHTYERACHSSLVDEVVIATSNKQGDDGVAEYCESAAIECTRGSESDVLDRYYQTAREYEADVVVRLTADCPFLSPAVIDRVVHTYQHGSSAYVSNTLEYTHPDGLDVEVFSFESVERAWNDANDPAEREHVTPYIKDSPEFKTQNVENVLEVSAYDFVDDDTILRWTVDYREDLEFVRSVYEQLTDHGHWIFDQQAVLELLDRKPELRDINDDR
jgi:spore coat polysaccharide biosynthesis protein SpsF